jgi:hypothetical protein
MTSCFEVFIEMNLMVQLEFNLNFWFISYNIFLLVEVVGPATACLSPLLSLTLAGRQQRRGSVAGPAHRIA